jgi:PKD repeat protein
VPTPPLPIALINKIKARNQSFRFEAVLRETRQFRAYCCNIDSATIMGVSKEPVVILAISPNPVCLGSAISWNFAGSYAPGSSIVSYLINFGDASSSSASSGTHIYAAAGEYTVTATIEEGAGLTQTIEIEINVIDCSDTLLLTSIYAATDGNGVWYLE